MMKLRHYKNRLSNIVRLLSVITLLTPLLLPYHSAKAISFSPESQGSDAWLQFLSSMEPDAMPMPFSNSASLLTNKPAFFDMTTPSRRQQNQNQNGDPLSSLPSFAQAIGMNRESGLPNDPVASLHPVVQADIEDALALAELTPEQAELLHQLNEMTSFLISTTTESNSDKSLTSVAPAQDFRSSSKFQSQNLQEQVSEKKTSTDLLMPLHEGTVPLENGRIRIVFGKHNLLRTIEVQSTVAPAGHDQKSHAIGTHRYGTQVGAAFTLSAINVATQETIVDFPHEVVFVEAAAESPAYVSSIEPGITIYLSFTDEELSGLDYRTLALYSRQDSDDPWQRIPSAVYYGDHLLIAHAEQLGEFALIAQAPSKVNAELTASTTVTTTAPRIVLDPDDDVGHVVWPDVGYVSELPYNYQLATQVEQKLVNECGAEVLITRTDSDPYVDRALRRDAALAFNPDFFVTLAFDALLGIPWGSETDGGATGYAKGPANNIVFAGELSSQVSAYTTRPDRGVNQTHPLLPYAEFEALPGTLAHLETLYLDHNFDWPIIYTAFPAVVNGVYAGILNQLAAEGFTCGGIDPGLLLPPPPSAEEIARWRNLGQMNYSKYGYTAYYQRFGADPVSFSTGNYVLNVDLFSLPGLGNQSIDLNLVYNAQDSRNGRFGYGWTFPYSASAQRYSDESISVTLWDGRTYHYTPDGAGFTPPAGTFATLQSDEEGIYVYEEPIGVTLTFSETVYGFSVMTDWVDDEGNHLAFEYDLSVLDGWTPEDGELPLIPLLSITDEAGQTVILDHNETGHITSATMPDGRIWTFAYNDASDLVAITDANDGTRHYQYDEEHRITHHWDPEGILYLQNIYDAEGRVVEQIDASGVHLFITYDADNGTTTYTDNAGNTTIYYYDDLYRITQVQDALGNSEYFDYDDQYNLVAYTDKRGNTWTYTHDDRGNVLTETDPDGFVTSYTYDENNDITSITDMGGPNNTPRTTQYVYENGNLVQIIRPDGASIYSTYDAYGQMLTLMDANGHTTSYDYDDYGNLVRVTDALGYETTYTYDAAGRNTGMTDANGNSAEFLYDANDNVVQIVDALGNAASFTYDKNDNLVQMVDRRGGVTTYEYDENLKLLREVDPEGHPTTYQYDVMYNRTTMTDANGNTTLYHYDDIYQLIAVETAEGGITVFAYDANGNLISVTDALQQTTTFAYDDLNRMIALTDAEGNVTVMAYDAVGRRTTLTNPRGAITTFFYDILGRLTLVRDALGGEWTTTYDPVGNILTNTDANGHTHTMQYDVVNRLTHSIDADGDVTVMTYDGVGNLLTTTDALGRVTSYAYDDKDNLQTITDALGSVTSFQYDAEDNLTAVTDANQHTTTFAYDLDGLLITLVEAGGQVTGYTYDPAHNLTTVTNAKGNSWTYSYDVMNRRVSETDPLNHTTLYTYDLLGRLTHVTDANGITTRYDYDGLDRLTSVVQNFVADQPGDHETNVTTLYQYDSVGNLTHIIDANDETTTFAYDLLDRLVQEINPIGNVWQYGYDAVGNMLNRLDANGIQTLYQYNADDFLTATIYPNGESVTYTYDAVNNQISMSEWLGATTNVYDALNRLVSTTNHVGQTVAYTYDAVGNRTSVTYPDGKVMTYVYDPTNFVTQITDPTGHVYNITRDDTHNAVLIDYPNLTTAQYNFDAAERLTNVTNAEDTGEIISAFDYTLDTVGNRTRVDGEYAWRQPPTLSTDYEYDPLYRLTHSEDDQGRYTTYGFDAVGNRVQLVTNYMPTLDNRTLDEMTIEYAYNGANQLLSTVDSLMPVGHPKPDRVRQVNQMLQTFVHEVEAQRDRHIDAATADQLLADTYELLDDLNSNHPPNANQVETRLEALVQVVTDAGDAGLIDNAGVVNSLLVKLQHALDANRRQGGALMATLYYYDANGNRTARLAPDMSTATDKDWLRTNYGYDYENRLVRAQNFRDSGNDNWHPQDETQLTYDGYGRVFRRLHDQHQGGGGQKWRDYVYDGLDPIAEYLHPSSQYVNYYRGLGRILHMDNQPTVSTGGVLYYMHYDGLNSVSALTKHQGQSAHTYRYYDYGTILDNNDHAADSGSFTNPHNHYTYTGQEWDEYNNLFHFYAREYDPATGTWLQQDPYRGIPASPTLQHRYAYVGNNPTTYYDIMGFKECSGIDLSCYVDLRIAASNANLLIVGSYVYDKAFSRDLFQHYLSEDGSQYNLSNEQIESIKSDPDVQASINTLIDQVKDLPNRTLVTTVEQDQTPSKRTDIDTALGDFTLGLNYDHIYQTEDGIVLSLTFGIYDHYDFNPHVDPFCPKISGRTLLCFGYNEAMMLEDNGLAQQFDIRGSWTQQLFIPYDPTKFYCSAVSASCSIHYRVGANQSKANNAARQK